MIPPRRVAVLLACLLIAGPVVGQSPSPTAAPFADDDRGARVVERYRAMLSANPAEGMALDRLWKMYEERNATAALIDEYRRATDTSDKPADALVYGHLLKRAGRLDEAAGSYERAARLDPASPLPLVAQAGLALDRSQPAEAAALLERAIVKTPGSDRRRAEWQSKLGEAWLAAGQPSKACEAWENIIAANPSDLALRKQLAATYEKNGLPERAIVHYEYLDRTADPAGRATALRELGRLHEVRGEFDAARDALERGLALTSRDNWLYAELQTRLIRLYQRAGKTSELETRWKDAVEQAPRDLGGYGRLVALAEAQGDPAAARFWLEKLVALSPRDRDNTLKLARVLSDAGENERAVALYDAVLKLQPGNLDLIFARADLDMQANHTAEAVARVEDRVRQNPADESISVPALQWFLSRHLDSAAEKLLASAVARQPGSDEPALAQAKFYFAHARVADAHSVLERLVRQPAEPAAPARHWIAAADCYKDAGETDEALRCWREASRLQPDSRAALVAVGALQMAAGDIAGGTAQLERASAACPEGTERDEIERKLFQALLEHSPSEDIVPAAPGRWRGGVGVVAPGKLAVPGPALAASIFKTDEASQPKGSASPLLLYLAQMEKTAREKPGAAVYLRLARWLQWAHRLHDAGLAADSALALDPRSIAAREILADTATSLHNHGAALKRLREIAALDPARKPAVIKRIADLMLEDGAFDGALVLLDRRAQDEPGSVDALTDLALAQQRADRWFDALAIWERAYALPRLTPAQRANLRRPLVACYEHVGEYGRAAELLQAAIDAQDDPAARQDLFRELVAFCQGHSLGAWLEGLYNGRLAAQPQDYFAMTAVAELRKAAGDPRSAYELLERAYYSSPDPATALRTLVAEAEALGEGTKAVAHQRRLAGLPGQANAETLEKLATLEETNLDDEAAARQWEQIAVKFPRDTVTLGAAADYFTRARQPGRARGLLAKVAEIDPGDFRRLSQLAQLHASAGDAAGARACLETILAHTRPEAPRDALVLPRELDPSVDPAEFMAAAAKSAVHAPGGTPDPATGSPVAEGGERDARLQAIGELSRLLFARDGTASDDERRRWLDRWHSAAAGGARSEPVTAFFHAGEKAAVSDLTAAWLKAPDSDEAGRAEKIFLLAGLRMENYPPLVRWVWENRDVDSAERVSRLVETIGYFLSTGGRPPSDMVAQLFPADLRSRSLLWQVASGTFADKRWYPQAVELGERALALPGGSIAFEAYQLAQWDLDVGRIDAARAILRRAVDEGEGTAFDATAGNAVFADLRAYYFLLPAAERSGFMKDYFRRMQKRGGTGVHAILAAALLYGLAGDETAACRELDRIVDVGLLDERQRTESPDMRRWNYLFVCGTQLQAWHLDRLAAHVWRRGRADASSFDRRDPEVRNVLGEIRLYELVAEAMTAADPQETHELVTEYLRESPAVIVMASAASVLMNAGQSAAAIQIYERLCRAVPSEPEYTRALLEAQISAGDQAADSTLAALLDGNALLPNSTNRLEFVTQRAALAEGSGDADRACDLLLNARRTYPGSLAVLRPLALTLERRQRLDDAAAIWREAARHDRGAASVEALASLELRRGHREAAFALARDAQDPPTEAEQTWWFGRRVELYLTAGHATEAVELARQRLKGGKFGGLSDAGASLASQGQREAAGELLTAAVHLARDPLVRFEMQQALVRNVCTAPDVPMEEFLRELRRLEQFADVVPGRREVYVDDRYYFARARGATVWLEDELRREWNDGHGAIVAGEQLLNRFIETRRWDAVHALVAAVDARPNLPEPTLFSIATKLLETGHATWALPISERLCRRFPQKAEYAETRARVLWQAGRRDEAVRVLEALDATRVFRDDFSGRTAFAYLEMGDRVHAISSLQDTVALDPFAVRAAPLYCRLAALYVEDGRTDEARQMLAAAYRNPTQTDMKPLVDYLAATRQLESDAAGELPGGDLPLTYLRRAQLFAAVYDRSWRSGHEQAAFRLAIAHPELLPPVPSLAEALRRDATPDQIPALTKLVETAVNQSEIPTETLHGTLAKLYVRRAEPCLTAQPPRPAEALDFLSRAYALEPEDFAVVQPFASALRKQHQDSRAKAVLKPFLDADALPSENAAARQIIESNN